VKGFIEMFIQSMLHNLSKIDVESMLHNLCKLDVEFGDGWNAHGMPMDSAFTGCSMETY